MPNVTPAFDCYGTLDFVIYAILNALGLNPERLDARPGIHFTTHDEIARRNARKLVNHFGAKPIHAIKEIREHSGMDLKSSRDAWEHIVEAYEVDADYHRASIARCLEDDNLGGMEYHLSKFRQCER